MGMYESANTIEADFDVHKSSVSGLDRKNEFDAQQLLAQSNEDQDLWAADGQEENSAMVGVKKMRDELKHIFKDETADGHQQDMITPIDEMQTHNSHQPAKEKQKESFKYL